MDLTRLRPVFEHDGPFLTLHVEVGRATEDAAQQWDARWTTIRHDLERADVDPKLVADLGERLHENTHAPGEVRRTVVAAPGEVILDEIQVGHSAWPETVDHGDLPDLAGWLSVADRELPFVLVVADREGADIDVYRATSLPREHRESVEGQTFHITKVPEGDWAQKQFQQTAENAWNENAELVADTVRSLAREHRPRAVLVAGDVRARSAIAQLLEDGEPGAAGTTIAQIEAGGRAAGASQEALWDAARVILADLEATADSQVAGALDEARGRGEGAAHGVDEVLDALVRTKVDRLVLDLPAAADKTVDPRRHEGLALPASAAQCTELPADRVLVAAGALTGAQLSLLPAELSHGGGVSALQRWTD